ncbi:hypothetical protein [Flavivirga jejuensis]|uniref:Uncharacterized protein n=1 Tax=Flavivirga jejuensis TaxID=870487 RepID=A0ABT8WK38_9FLAO|nr:hypothetical protein [Flavivirga jejuensis]MDO5973505.1 hypothetical protein [Flavivirga jejuensis]
MEFTQEQLELIKSENPQIEFELKNEEVLAFYSLGQMHNKIVKMTDNFFGNTKIGLFTIDDLNGKTDLDFSNPDDWTEVHIETISFSLTCSNDWGGKDTSTFQNLLDIKSIALLKK